MCESYIVAETNAILQYIHVWVIKGSRNVDVELNLYCIAI